MEKTFFLSYPENADAPFFPVSEKGSLEGCLRGCAEKNGILFAEKECLNDVVSAAEIADMVPDNIYRTLAGIFDCIMKLEDSDEC